MIKLNNKGVAPLMLIGIVVLALIVGATGYYVYNINKKYQTSSNNQSIQNTSTESCNNSEMSQLCIEKATALRIRFSKLPVDLQKVAIDEIAKQAPSCVKNNKLVDINGQSVDPQVEYAPVGSAIIDIGCDGGAASLFAKDLKSNQWSYIESTQMNFNCDSVFNAPVPKKLLEFDKQAVCLDSTGNLQPYDTESKKRFL